MIISSGKAEDVFDDHQDCVDPVASTAKFYVTVNVLWLLLIIPVLYKEQVNRGIFCLTS